MVDPSEAVSEFGCQVSSGILLGLTAALLTAAMRSKDSDDRDPVFELSHDNRP
jgi:hypothetical protein